MPTYMKTRLSRMSMTLREVNSIDTDLVARRSRFQTTSTHAPIFSKKFTTTKISL